MDKVTFYNKRLLCYTEDTDFTDYQGIGSDPMYLRYNSLQSIVNGNIDESYRSFFAASYYDDGAISWYIDEWEEVPQVFSELEGEKRDKYSKIKDATLSHYDQKMKQMPIEERVVLMGALRFVDDQFIYCYDNKITLITWGMRPDTSKHIESGSWIKGLKIDEYIKISFDAGSNGRLKTPVGRIINRIKGYELELKDYPQIVSSDGFNFVGWSPDLLEQEIFEDVTITALYEEIEHVEKETLEEDIDESERVTVTFDAGGFGEISGNHFLEVNKGDVIERSLIPFVISKEGFRFVGWTPSIKEPVTSNTLFVANYEQSHVRYKFDSGEHGILEGNNEFIKQKGEIIDSKELPKIKAKKGYRFTGWNASPYQAYNSDKLFRAQYETNIPWYKKVKLWFTDSGCLKWLLWALLIIFLLWLFSFLFRGCGGNTFGIGGRNPGSAVVRPVPIATIEGHDGIIRDDNGKVAHIIDSEGRLPDGDRIVAPIVDIESGETPPVVVENEGFPEVIANRLNIYFENEDADMDQWANDFKSVYPSDDYKVIGFDENVRLIQIQIPEQERGQVRDNLNAQIPNHDFFVVDEYVITLRGLFSTYANSSSKGWHLESINLKSAWTITQGSPDIVIAIVDDGIDYDHKIFDDRIHKSYNVFTGNNSLSKGGGHGTHIAAIAAGNADYYDKGVAGIAPESKIMPVQVFDNGMCTFSSIASGIMYAIHNGADIVNISIGPNFTGLDQLLTISEQEEVAQTFFKNEEKVFRHIINTANKKNVFLVFAAGNDNILASVLPECRMDDKTFNVAAVDSKYTASGFTNYHTGTNISAPGVDIYSAFTNNSFRSLDGTSMAAPIVSGTLALMKSLDSTITVDKAIDVFQKTGKPIELYVPPMVLVDKAVEYVNNGYVTKDSDIDNSSKQDSVSDDNSNLLDELENLESQKQVINEQISAIKKKINKQ